MSEAAERAEHLRAQRPIHDWVRRFRQLAKEMPPEVWVFVANGVPHVMATTGTPKGGRYIVGVCMDPDAVVATADAGRWDGGDF